MPPDHRGRRPTPPTASSRRIGAWSSPPLRKRRKPARPSSPTEGTRWTRPSRRPSPSPSSTHRPGTSPEGASSSRGPRTAPCTRSTFARRRRRSRVAACSSGRTASLVPKASTTTALAVATPGSVRGLRRGAPAPRPPALGEGRRAGRAPRTRGVSRPRRVLRGPGRGEGAPVAVGGDAAALLSRRGPASTRGSPQAARSRRDARANRAGGPRGVPPRRGRLSNRGLRPVARRRPLGRGPRRVRPRLEGPRGDPVRPVRDLHDAAPVVGGPRPPVGPGAARDRERAWGRRARRGLLPPAPRGRAARVRRSQPLAGRRGLQRHPPRRARRARPPRGARRVHRNGASDPLGVRRGARERARPRRRPTSRSRRPTGSRCRSRRP